MTTALKDARTASSTAFSNPRTSTGLHSSGLSACGILSLLRAEQRFQFFDETLEYPRTIFCQLLFLDRGQREDVRRRLASSEEQIAIPEEGFFLVVGK